jgi:hypothetical protein
VIVQRSTFNVNVRRSAALGRSGASDPCGLLPRRGPNPISANLIRGVSMDDWLLSRRDGLQ